jgi:hypothetical protein
MAVCCGMPKFQTHMLNPAVLLRPGNQPPKAHDDGPRSVGFHAGQHWVLGKLRRQPPLPQQAVTNTVTVPTRLCIEYYNVL